MQTFVPYMNNEQTAECLDRRRLGKQRVEALQILKALRDGGGWKNHPAVRMWRGYEISLARYGIAICNAWIRRGYKDTCLEKIISMIDDFSHESGEPPHWWGGEIHTNHRGRLLEKDPIWYGQFEWQEDPVAENYWPV